MLKQLLYLGLAAALALCATGCSRPFFRSLTGTQTAIAVSIPDEDYIKLNIVSYLNGELVTIRDPSWIKYKFKTAETNSYFGIVRTEAFRESEIRV